MIEHDFSNVQSTPWGTADALDPPVSVTRRHRRQVDRTIFGEVHGDTRTQAWQCHWFQSAAGMRVNKSQSVSAASPAKQTAIRYGNTMDDNVGAAKCVKLLAM